MPRKAAPIPPIQGVVKDLDVESVRVIIEATEREEQRRIALVARLRVALEKNDIPQVVTLAREVCGLEDG